MNRKWIPALILVAIVVAIVWLARGFFVQAPIDKAQVLQAIEQEQLEYDRKSIRTMKTLYLNGDPEVAAALARKYVETTRVRLLPDEQRGAEVPSKYRPYLKFRKLDVEGDRNAGRFAVHYPQDISFGIGISVHPLFKEVDLLRDPTLGYEAICHTAVEELGRLRTNGIFDSDRVYAILALLRSKASGIRRTEHQLLTCELLYAYSCFEHWPSIREDVHRVLGGLYGRAANKMCEIVDDDGIEVAIGNVDVDILRKFKEAGPFNGKATPPGRQN